MEKKNKKADRRTPKRGPISDSEIKESAFRPITDKLFFART